VLGEKRYGRYMDDMYIICPTKEEVHFVINGITERANELGLFINEKKTQIHKLSDRFTYLQIKYFLDEKGKVVKRINPKTITRERRKLKKYKNLMDKGKMPYEDIKQAYKSWMGTFTPLMSKKQIKNMRKLFYDLFQEDVRWKK
jgi:septation ring formation regulator EzrA